MKFNILPVFALTALFLGGCTMTIPPHDPGSFRGTYQHEGSDGGGGDSSGGGGAAAGGGGNTSQQTSQDRSGQTSPSETKNDAPTGSSFGSISG